MKQTSPGTLYFFITIPVSQSITQRESPPQVATNRLPPPAPVQTRKENLFLFSSDEHVIYIYTLKAVHSDHLSLVDALINLWGLFLKYRTVPVESGCGWKAQAHSWVEKSSELSCLLWHWRTWRGFRCTGCWRKETWTQREMGKGDRRVAGKKGL